MSNPTRPSNLHKPKSISIRDVAELAGVSLGSASRVINKVENVSERTRHKVETAIAALGYRPNHAAQSLRLRSSRTVGCLFTDVANPLYAILYRALEERLRPAGYMMLLANGLNRADRELEILSTFVSRGMDGLFLAPGHEQDAQVLEAVRTLPVPAVIIDRDLGAVADTLLFDHAWGVQSLVCHLLGLNHTRIALVITTSTTRPIRERIAGYRQGLESAGLAVDASLILAVPEDGGVAFEAVKTLMASAQRPTALVVMGAHAFETINALSGLGLRVPDDVSLVVLGDLPFAAHHTPPLATLRIDLDAAAGHAAELLLTRMRGDAAEARTVTLRGDILPRASCGPARPPG